jgi:hypothetical protein
MAGSVIAALALVLLAVLIFAVIYFRRRRKPRIRILPKEKGVLIRAAAKRHCPVCGNLLETGQATVHCTLNSAHVVHVECKQLMKGLCPTCRGALQ